MQTKQRTSSLMRVVKLASNVGGKETVDFVLVRE